MPADNLPPLRIRENDGSPNVIPVFSIILSTNLTMLDKGGGIISISATTGAGGTAQDPITFPLIVGSGGTGIASTGSATTILGVNTSGVVFDYYRLIASDNLTILRANSAYFFSAITNAAGSNIVYAATGNSYIVTDLAADLTGEFRLVQSGNSISVTTATGLITINASTGDLSVKQDTITYPLGINSGGTGQTSFLSYAILYGSGITRVQTMPVLGSGALVVGSAATAAPQILNVGSHGQMLTVNTSVAGALQWANTLGGSAGVVYAATENNYVVMNLAGDLTNEYRLVQSGNSITITTDANTIVINAVTGGGGGTQIISIPMALLSVEVNSGNAFWTAATDLTNMDRAYVNMTDSGRSVSTWWCEMPRNLNATPAWGVDILSQAVAGGSAGGFIVLNVDGMSATVGESANTLAASTIQLVVATSFRLNTANILSISTLTATNFDAALATSATDYVKIKITRQGNADTLNSDWWIYNVKANVTVNT